MMLTVYYIFSSPELKVQVRFSDFLFFVYLSINFSHFHLLLNLWANFSQTLLTQNIFDWLKWIQFCSTFFQGKIISMLYQFVRIIITFAPAIQHIIYPSTSFFLDQSVKILKFLNFFLERIILETIWKNKTIFLHAGDYLRFDRNKCKNRENGIHFTCKALLWKSF